jgi:hypothetical protein
MMFVENRKLIKFKVDELISFYAEHLTRKKNKKEAEN